MMKILTCSTGTHRFRNNLKLFEISTFFCKIKYQIKVTTLFMPEAQIQIKE